MSKTCSGAEETFTYSPWGFRSWMWSCIVLWIMEGVFESTLWKLDRPLPLGLLAARTCFHRDGSVVVVGPHPAARFFMKRADPVRVMPGC